MECVWLSNQQKEIQKSFRDEEERVADNFISLRFGLCRSRLLWGLNGAVWYKTLWTDDASLGRFIPNFDK